MFHRESINDFQRPNFAEASDEHTMDRAVGARRPLHIVVALMVMVMPALCTPSQGQDNLPTKDSLSEATEVKLACAAMQACQMEDNMIRGERGQSR